MVLNAALLFTDIVDSTSTTQRLGDEGAAALWKEHDRRARVLLRQHNGREIGRSDGLLMSLKSSKRASAADRPGVTCYGCTVTTVNGINRTLPAHSRTIEKRFKRRIGTRQVSAPTT